MTERRRYTGGRHGRGGPALSATSRMALRLLHCLRPDLSLAELGRLFGISRQSAFNATVGKEFGPFLLCEPFASRTNWLARLRELWEAERTTSDTTEYDQAFAIAGAAATWMAGKIARVGA